MREPEHAIDMGRRARAHVVAGFGLDSEAERIAAVYRQVWDRLDA